MFLFNMFNRSSGNEEDKFDKITFKIDIKQNLPRLIDLEKQKIFEEQQLTPNHPLYYQIFPKKQQKHVAYVVGENDTISGLAVKLNISESIIKNMNNISDNIYPGMKLKLPQNTDLSLLTQRTSDKTQKIRISQLLISSQKIHDYINLKFNVAYYAGLTGYIKGTLTINSNYIIFNPSLEDQKNIDKYTVQKLLKFNAIIQIGDIQDTTYLQIPQMGDFQVPRKLSVIQFMLYRVGNAKIQKKYKQRLKQLKIDHKAIASVTFSIQQTQVKTGCELGNQIIEKVNQLVSEYQSKKQIQQAQKDRLTNIPFFDIIHQNVAPKIKQQKPIQGKVIKPQAILGTLSQPSSILNNQEFSNLIKYFPVLYQLYNWSKVYSSTQDGTSFSTFLNRAKNIQPAILLIKQHKGYKFGAFLIESIQTGKSGRGQMFIFSYLQDKLVPQIYRWTTKNDMFVYCQKQMGLGIGMGFKYGIFLKNDLHKGSTGSTITFGNSQILSKKQDFSIGEIQLWGLDQSF